MGRNKLDYETDRVVFQIPKEIKCKLKEELSPLVKEKVRKWKKKQANKK